MYFYWLFPYPKRIQMLLPSITKVLVSCDVTFIEDEFYYPNTSLQREESHWDPMVSMPISLLISLSSPNIDPIQTDAVDHSQPATVETAHLDSSTSPNPLLVHQPAEPMTTDLGGGLCLEKPTKVY